MCVGEEGPDIIGGICDSKGEERFRRIGFRGVEGSIAD